MNTTTRRFRDLHAREQVLIMPNAWDAASAALVRSAGADAIATTSAAVAWSRGYPDGNAMPADEVLSAARSVLRGAAGLPVSIDLEAGYSDDPASVTALVAQLAEFGVSAINLEDGYGDPAAFEGKVAAIKRAVTDTVFVNARTDVFLHSDGGPDAVRETCERARRYSAAGADGIFVPAIVEAADIAAVAAATNLPLNVMAMPGLPAAPALYRLGVRRLSAGGAIASCAYGVAAEAIRAFLAAGDSAVLFEGPRVEYARMNESFATPVTA